jgi:hypothetical protein
VLGSEVAHGEGASLVELLDYKSGRGKFDLQFFGDLREGKAGAIDHFDQAFSFLGDFRRTPREIL